MSDDQQERISRDNAMDLLRIIAAFLVVMIHSHESYMLLYRSSSHGAEMPGLLINCIVSFMRAVNWAVPIFFFSSGAFVLSNPKTGDFASFYHKTWKRLGIPTLVFTVIYLIANPIYSVLTGSVPDPVKAVGYELLSTIKGTPAQHMWYMFVLIGMYLCAPFLYLAKEKIGSKAFTKIAVIVYIWGVISGFVSYTDFYWTPGTIASLLGMFMLGNVIRDKAADKKNKKLAIVCAVAGIVLWIMLTFLYMVKPHGILRMFGTLTPYNPLVGIIGGLFFASAVNSDIRREFAGFATLTYYIYLVHPLVLMPFGFMGKVIVEPLYSVTGEAAIPLEILILAIVVFILSALISRIINRIQTAK